MDVITVDTFNALICDNRPSALYKINSIIDCKDKVIDVYEVELYKSNIKHYVSEARAVEVELLTCKTTYYFFGSKKEWPTTSGADISAKDLKDLLDRGSCDGTLSYLKYPISNTHVCDYVWPKSKQTTVIRCTFRKGIVTTIHGGHMTSNLGNTLNCNYSTGFCVTHDKVAITFSPDPTEQEDYLLVGKFNATLIGSHLVIHQLGMSLKIQNTDLGMHLTGGFKLDVIRKIKSRNNLNKLQATLKNDLDRFKEEVTAKLNFIFDKVTGPIAETKTICQTIQINNQLIRSMANSNPTYLIRVLLNNNNLQAIPVGNDFVAIYPCKEIKNVTWKNPDKNICTLGIPVQFNNGIGIANMFLDTKTKIMTSKVPKINCRNAQDQYFDLENKLYLYKAGHKPVVIPNKTVKMLPMLHTNNSGNLYEFPDEWTYNESSKLDISSLIWEYMDDRLDKLSKQNTHTFLEFNEASGLTILGFLGLSREHIIHGIINLIFRVMSLLGCLAFISICCKARNN